MIDYLAINSYDTFGIMFAILSTFLCLMIMHAHVKNKLLEIEKKIEELDNE